MADSDLRGTQWCEGWIDTFLMRKKQAARVPVPADNVKFALGPSRQFIGRWTWRERRARVAQERTSEAAVGLWKSGPGGRVVKHAKIAVSRQRTAVG